MPSLPVSGAFFFNNKLFSEIKKASGDFFMLSNLIDNPEMYMTSLNASPSTKTGETGSFEECLSPGEGVAESCSVQTKIQIQVGLL